MNTLIVRNVNDCPNLLSYGATFRMGVLIPSYPKDILVKGENVPDISKMRGDKMRNGTMNGTSNVFQILGDIQKMTYDIQQLIEKYMICHGVWKISAAHRNYPRTTSISMAHIGNRFILMEEDGLSDSCRCLLQVHSGEEMVQSTSAAVCIELSMIVTELGLPHITRSDNGQCYNSKEFQQFLRYYSITHQTSSPNNPRSNGFIERMVGVAKKLMDKAGKEGKLWISGVFYYRVTPQSGSIASSLQLMTHSQGKKLTTTAQCTWCPRNAPNLPGAPQKAREK